MRLKRKIRVPKVLFSVEALEARRLLDGSGVVFADPVNYPAGGAPARVLAADVNNDEILDLMVSNSSCCGGGGRLSVLLGNGDGTFARQRSFAAGQSSIGGAADYDADGDIDISVANPQGGGSFSVLLNDGVTGTDWNGFSRPSNRIPMDNSPQDVVSGDLDGDGDMDMVVGSGGDVSVLLNNGASNGQWDGFAVFDQYAAGRHSSTVQVGYVDGDGDLDIVVGNYLSGDITVLLGRGNGSFDEIGNFEVGNRTGSVELGDLDGDGNLDIAATVFGRPTVVWLRGDGQGDFERIEMPVSTGGALRSGDFDSDGDLDSILIPSGAQSILLLANQGDGTFLEEETHPGVPSERRGSAVADFDADGDLDLAVATAFQSGTSCVNCGVEVFLNVTTPPVPDLDGDTDADCDDVDALVGAIAEGIEPPGFDLTDDDIVDNADLDMWLELAGAVNLPSGNPYPRGDADLNGRVDATDLNQVALHWRHNEAAWCSGDFTADGIVDAADLNALALNWQFDVSETSEADPEAAAAAGRRAPRAPLKYVVDRTLIGIVPATESVPASTKHSRDGVNFSTSALKGPFAGQESRDVDVDVPRRRRDSSPRFTIRANNLAAVEAGERDIDNNERIGRWLNNVNILNGLKRELARESYDRS